MGLKGPETDKYIEDIAKVTREGSASDKKEKLSGLSKAIGINLAETAGGKTSVGGTPSEDMVKTQTEFVKETTRCINELQAAYSALTGVRNALKIGEPKGP